MREQNIQTSMQKDPNLGFEPKTFLPEGGQLPACAALYSDSAK